MNRKLLSKLKSNKKYENLQGALPFNKILINENPKLG